MIGAAAAYMAGLFFASFFTDPALLLTTAAIIAAALLAGRKYGFRTADYIMMTVCFAAAVSVFSIYTHIKYVPVVRMDGCEGSFSGDVEEVQHYSSNNAQYILKGKINGDINAKVTLFVNDVEAEIGDRITVENCIFSKHSKDYLFDSERYYKPRGIFLSIDSVKGVNVLHTSERRFSRNIEIFRERIISDFNTYLGKDSGDFLAGMVFGEKRGMDSNIKTAVYRCGIGHVLAVSGLHVSIAVFVIMSILRLFHINKFVSFVLMELLLMFLVTMAHYPASAIRAAIMMNFLYAAHLFLRQNDTFNSLACAVLLICLAQPYIVYDTGFILSVAGTFGIGVFAPYMTKNMPTDTRLHKLMSNAAVMLCTTLSVFPFSLLFFDETSLISPITNCLIVPLCSVSMVAGLIYALTGGLIDLLFISKFINDFILRFSDKAARLRFSHFSSESTAVIGGLLICIVITALVVAVFRRRYLVCCTVALSLIFLFISSGFVRSIRNRSTIIGVLGKGNNAVLVISSGGTANMIDLSGHYRSASYVRKYLIKNDINSVDTAVFTNRIQSSYASYAKELDFISVGKWLVSGETSIAAANADISCLGDKDAVLLMNNCNISLSESIVSVKTDTVNISFVSDNSHTVEANSLTVKYGKAASGKESAGKNTILLNEQNNLEIILSDSGSCDIRRL